MTKYYACTISARELVQRLSSIDKVYEFFSNGYKDFDIHIIAVERNQINQNQHYHVLASSDYGHVYIGNWVQEIANIDEVKKYFNYCKKDGKYKLYKALPFDTNDNKSWYERALKGVYQYPNMLELLQAQPDLIKYIHKVRALYDLIYNYNRERGEL